MFMQINNISIIRFSMNVKYFRMMMLIWARILERKMLCAMNQYFTRVSTKYLFLSIVVQLMLYVIYQSCIKEGNRPQHIFKLSECNCNSSGEHIMLDTHCIDQRKRRVVYLHVCGVTSYTFSCLRHLGYVDPLGEF